MEGVEQRVASAVAEAAQKQDEEWGMMMDPAEIDVIAAFLKPSTVMLEWCVLSRQLRTVASQSRMAAG
jgi:hypothetical protein